MATIKFKSGGMQITQLNFIHIISWVRSQVNKVKGQFSSVSLITCSKLWKK